MLIAQWELPAGVWPGITKEEPLWGFAHIAIDKERNVFLSKSGGNSRRGTGTRYSLWRDFEKAPDSSAKWCHRFKAFNNGEAVEHCRKFLESHWK